MQSYASSPVYTGLYPAAVMSGADAASATPAVASTILARHATPFARTAAVVAASTGSGKAWNARYAHPVPHDNMYYFKCMMAGVLSCGLTHTAICPLDVVKCNMQTNPTKYKGVFSGMKTIIAEEGSAGLLKGWHATLVGYSMQGFCKFGFYEIFKDLYMNLAGEKNAYEYRGLIYLAGSASAEFFADVALCPMEMVKVKIQTTPAELKFPTGLGAAVAAMRADPASRFPLGSVVPLWSRQIPYTMAKFYFFEKVVEAFYTYMFTNDRSTYSKGTQLGITFASGYIAGVICAIVSHPADTVVSVMSKPGAGSIGDIVADLGFGGLWKGLLPRIVMIGTLTGLQWWIYDTFKTTFGMGTSGGVQKKH